MTELGLFFGSTTGNTRAAAQLIAAEFDRQFGLEPERLDVADVYLDEMETFDFLVIGMPTWNIGQLQRDWEAILEEFSTVDLSGKPVALFGLGDQVGYPDSFGDALVFIAEQVEARGAHLVGAWPTDGYLFNSSWAVRDGNFIGLMLDEDNQADLTQHRIETWVAQIGRATGLDMIMPSGEQESISAANRYAGNKQ